MTRPTNRTSGPRVSRDQADTGFTRILSELVARVPGVRAAAVVDFEGETVDYSGVLSPYDARIAAAQWRIVIDGVHAQPGLAGAWFVALRAGKAGYEVYALPDGYALVLVLSRAAGFAMGRRAVAACCQALAKEASWKGMRLPAWFAVQVTVDGKRRPVAVGDGPHARPIEILGAVVGGMATNERGWRIRLPSGVEATLVREPGDSWYIDECPS